MVGRWPWLLVLPLALAACGSSTSTTAPTDTGARAEAEVGPDEDAPTTYPDSLEGRVALRLLGCRGVESGCHGSEPPPAGLRLGRGPGLDLAQLANVPSTERPDWLRARPGDPAHSWVVAKLRDDRDAGVEAAMPLGSSGDPELAALMEAWIDAGARNPFLDAGPD